MDEAMHPLAILASGLYGRTLPPQDGAPIRLVTPWKYGFKGIKSIVKISLVEKQPPTTWNLQCAGRVWFLCERESAGGSSAVEPGDGAADWGVGAAGDVAVQWVWGAGGADVCGDGFAEEFLMAAGGRDFVFFGVVMVDTRFAKLVVWVNALVPAGLLVYDASQHRLGADPVNFAIRTTGMLTLVFIGLTLLVTPLRKLSGLQWLFHFRRILGLYAFFYSVSHFLIFFVLDQSLNVSTTFSEMIQRKYLLVGSAGVLMMVPLAVTSTQGMIRRMGAKRWKALHRLVYLVAIAGALHYYMLVKADIRKPVAFAMTFAILLGYRVVAYFVERRRVGKVVDSGKKPWSGMLRVASITQETADVRTFRLVPPEGGALPFEYQPGQYLTLSLLIDGKQVKRSYTIASTPSRGEVVK